MLILCVFFVASLGALQRSQVMAAASAFVAEKTPVRAGPGNYTARVLARLDTVIDSIPQNSPLRTRAETARANLRNHAETSPEAFERSARGALRHHSEEQTSAWSNEQQQQQHAFGNGADKLELLKRPGAKQQIHQAVMQKMASLHQQSRHQKQK